ncbi:MAG TPA: acyltransferase [Candidatus Thermoplasmatota archaeon]|nr:acyltransferase [Candidatus Thermoplasmatota archaeon]
MPEPAEAPTADLASDLMKDRPVPRLGPTGPRSYVPALQALRGLAALWVVVYHLSLMLAGEGVARLGVSGIRVGWLGVDLFFVLSAYLLGQPFLDGRAQRYGRFLLDRFLRIAPAYYVAGILAVVVLMTLQPKAWHPMEALASLVFASNTTGETLFGVNPVFWSLAVEMQFYVLLPLLALLFKGDRWPWGLALCVATSLLFRGLTFVYGGEGGLIAGTFWLPAFLGHFGLGLAAARLRFVRTPFLAAGAGFLLIGLPVATWIPATSFGYGFESLPGQVLVRPLAGAGFALLILAAATPGKVRRALEVAPLKVLGDLSYSLYLVHLPIHTIVAWVVDMHADRALFVMLAIAADLIYAATLYGLVELPGERWRHRRKAKARALAGLAGPG